MPVALKHVVAGPSDQAPTGDGLHDPRLDQNTGDQDAWQSSELAAAREAWTAGHVSARQDVTPARLLGDLQRSGQAYVQSLRRGDKAACDVPTWMLASALADLSAHLEDLNEALGVPSDPDAVVTRAGFSSFRSWLGRRISSTGLAPLLLTDGSEEWQLGGEGWPGASLTASRQELFRVISGRRSLATIDALLWEGDAAAYLPVLSPYPLPSEPFLPLLRRVGRKQAVSRRGGLPAGRVDQQLEDVGSVVVAGRVHEPASRRHLGQVELGDERLLGLAHGPGEHCTVGPDDDGVPRLDPGAVLLDEAGRDEPLAVGEVCQGC